MQPRLCRDPIKAVTHAVVQLETHITCMLKLPIEGPRPSSVRRHISSPWPCTNHFTNKRPAHSTLSSRDHHETTGGRWHSVWHHAQPIYFGPACLAVGIMTWRKESSIAWLHGHVNLNPYVLTQTPIATSRLFKQLFWNSMLHMMVSLKSVPAFLPHWR